MGSVGKAVGYGATGASIGSAAGPWGAAIGGAAGLLYGAFSPDGNNAAPAPGVANAQIGSNDLANQIAAQQYASGLQQQANQESRESALYNSANQNYDIANSAQMRGGPQIASSATDLQNQQNALNATYGQAGNLSDTGGQLTAMGTRAQGPSAAEAQLRQGQDAAMNQQLSMARSGRSLGSGQAALNQAAFNNAAINQTTNQQAAAARIQEDAAYRQSQINALQSAAGAYGQAGGLAGQAGNLATGIRAANEGVQTTNANLALQQQGVNNQTTGLYNQLGVAQQGLGMQANTLGQNAQQFGANQASNTLQAQLNGGLGLNSQINQINLANQANSNAHDAANMNMAASGLGAAATMYRSSAGTPANTPAPSAAPGTAPGNASGASGQAVNPPVNPDAPNFGTGGPVPDTSSDYRQKTNIQPMEQSSSSMSLSDQLRALNHSRAAHPPSLTAAPPPPTDAQKELAAINAQGGAYNPDGSLKVTPADDTHYRGIPMPEGNVKTAIDGKVQSPSDVTVPTPPPSPRSEYADALNMLNQGYQSNMNQPASVLWRAPGANQQMGAPQLTENHGINGYGPKYTLTQPDAPTGPAPAADTFQAPTYNQQYQAPAQYHAPTFTPRAPVAPVSAQYHGAIAPQIFTSSDVHSKTRIRELEGQVAALSQGAPPTASFAPQQPDVAALDASYRREGGQPRAEPGYDRAALDAAYAREQQPPAIDLRPARGYSYEYKDPNQPGAAPGTHVGPMAQDLQHTAAANTVFNTPSGLQVDTPRLTMTNTAAISELQRKLEALQAARGPQYAQHDQGLYPTTQAPY